MKKPAEIAILTTDKKSLFKDTIGEIERQGYGVDILEWEKITISIKEDSLQIISNFQARTSNFDQYKLMLNHVPIDICSQFYFAFDKLLNIKILNNWEGVLHSANKLKSSIKIQGHGIRQPKTVLLNNSNFEIGIAEAEAIMHYPMVMKEINSDNGEKVWLVEDCRSAWVIWNEAGTKDIFILQEYIKGENLRVVLLGNRIIYSVKNLLSLSDFRANSKFNIGTKPYPLTGTEQRQIVKISKCLGIHFAGLDFIKTRNGLYFIEANVKPGISVDNDKLKPLGINIFKEIGTYLIEELKKVKQN